MVKKIFGSIFIILLTYSFYLTFMPNYQYRLFKAVMRRVMRLTKEYDIPISPADVELELVHDQWSAKIYWEETIEYFPFYPLYQKNLEFYVDTTE
jgi:hypothetical protein